MTEENNQTPTEQTAGDDHSNSNNNTPATDNSLATRILELEKQLNEANEKAENMTVSAQRALADLQNFKRRTEEERSRFAQLASADLVREIIPHLDNFHRAFEHAPTADGKEWAESIKSIIDQLQKDLDNKGLRKMEALGQRLDPNFHEALAQGPGEKDVVIEILEPGYLLGDYVIKPARVKVGNGETA